MIPKKDLSRAQQVWQMLEGEQAEIRLDPNSETEIGIRFGLSPYYLYWSIGDEITIYKSVVDYGGYDAPPLHDEVEVGSHKGFYDALEALLTAHYIDAIADTMWRAGL